MADIEERAERGELTIAEAKREIFALRERFAAGPDRVMRWAAQAHAQRSMLAQPASNTEELQSPACESAATEDRDPASSSQPA